MSSRRGSFNEILRRHEVLRTLFKSEDGGPVQIVCPLWQSRFRYSISGHAAWRKSDGRKLAECSHKKLSGHSIWPPGP